MLLLPILCLLILSLMLWRPPQIRLASAILMSGVLIATFMFVTNHLLSGLGKLGSDGVEACWVTAVGVLMTGAVVSRRQRAHLRMHWRRLPRRWRSWRRGMTSQAWLSLGVIVLVGGLTLLVALLTQPNNHDVMSYHLPRVMHWLQNGHLAPFPTNIDRQIYQHPGAEHLQLQFFVLSSHMGSATHLVQWFAWAGCVLACGLIARRLGGSPVSQWLAMLLMATTPMAVFQSTNDKNDLLLSCMAMTGICMILWVAPWRNEPGSPARPQTPPTSDSMPGWLVALAGLALAWVLAIKGTGYVYLPPLAIGLAWACWRRGSGRLVAVGAVMCGLLVVGMMAVHWMNNLTVFGSIFGPVADNYRPQGNMLAAGVINAVRNIGSQLTTPAEQLNAMLMAVLSYGLKGLGLDIHDLHSMNYHDHYFLFGRGMLSEDHASSPWQMLLILVALPLVCWRGSARQRAYLCLWGAASAMFCMLVSWNEWINRLTLPLMLTAMPLAACGLGVARFDRWRGWCQRAIIWMCLVMAVPALFFNYNRSLLGSTSLLTHWPAEAQFLAQPQKKAAIAQAVAQVRMRHIRLLGLMFGGDEYEYPFWQELVWSNQASGGDGGSHVRLIHVDVRNDTANLRNDDSNALEIPETSAVSWLLVSHDRVTGAQMVVDGQQYHAVWAGDGFSLYRRGVKSE